MAAITTAPSERFVTGPLVNRFYTLTAVNNGDTLTIPGVRILAVDITPTTAVSIGATIASNVITFVSGGAWSGNVQVTFREG